MLKNMIFTLSLLLIFSINACSQSKDTASTYKEKPSYNYADCDIQAVGHRGYSDIYPENTLLSVEEAFKRGVKYCEIDVNVTKDDVYVLFHDQPTMYRTSNGQGYVVGSTYDELLKLDVGSWKGSQFEGTKIATLEEALVLAEKYDAYLYLDTKKFRPDLMGKALKTTNVSPSRLLPAIGNVEEAQHFKKYCPNSSFIYFGALPDDVNDLKWYKDLTDLGCVFFEVYYTHALKNEAHFQTFVNNVHKYGAKVWVFTSNDSEELQEIRKAKVFGVETDMPISMMKNLCDHQNISIKPLKHATGNWNFNNRDLFSLGIGSQLRPFNYRKENKFQGVSFGSTTSFGIKNIGGKEAAVIKVPAFDPNNGLFLFTNFTSGIHEDLQFEYSLILDIYIPKSSADKFIAILQTNPENENDGDLFITPKGIGINNNYHGSIIAETWNRIAVTFSEKAIKKYVNGKFVGEMPINGGRWSVYNTFPGGQNQGFLLFSDDDNETAELYVNAIQLRNYTMNSAEILHLGTANANGIPINNSGIYDVKFENELYPTIVNWDSKEIYITLPKTVDLANVKVSFKIPFGVVSNIKSESFINLNHIKTIEVTAQDGVSKTVWILIPEIQ